MEPEGSLPRSQEPATAPYPETDASIHPIHTYPTYFPEIQRPILTWSRGSSVSIETRLRSRPRFNSRQRQW